MTSLSFHIVLLTAVFSSTGSW